jgi:adenosylcobinamide-phosphate synthase
MTLFSILMVLLLEQARPLTERRALFAPLVRYAGFLEKQFNDGQFLHGAIAWALGVLPLVFVLIVLQLLLWYLQPVLAFVLNIAVLYAVVGFREFSHYFTDIHLALRMGELARARQLLAEWRQQSGDRLSTEEVARLAIEEALVAAHRCVCAPLMWFVLLGPAGAMLYRLSLFFEAHWGAREDPEFAAFGDFSRRAFAVINWLPLRLTAAAFAVVGDFEDAVYCWRTQGSRWPDRSSGILLASGAGALGVRLGQPITDEIDAEIAGGVVRDRPELGLGDAADADFMQSTIGLVWRTLVLGILLLVLVWLASWVGH